MLSQWDPYSFENQLNCCQVKNVDGGGGNDDDKKTCECGHTHLTFIICKWQKSKILTSHILVI
jgi:hypothetical protein